MHRLSAVVFIVAAAGLLATGGSARHAAAEDDLLHIVSRVTYDVRPDLGPLHVSWDIAIENNDPKTQKRNGSLSFYQNLVLPALRGAANVAARSADGQPLDVTLTDSPKGPVTSADVAFDKRLFYHDKYSFTLTYELPASRSDSLLVTPYYVFLPILASGDEATVTVSSPSDAAWEASLEAADCMQAAAPAPGQPATLTCSGQEAPYVAALVEVSRPDARITVPFDVQLREKAVSVSLTYFPGEEAFAQHVQDLTQASLPVIEDLYGFPYQAAPSIRIAQGGRQVVLGYEGLTTCLTDACDIVISPISDDYTVLHELAHLWSGIYARRWLSEGFAQIVAEDAAARLPAGLVRGRPPQRDPAAVALQLDEWGDVTSAVGAGEDELALQNAGYDRSLRFLYVLRFEAGADILRQVNAAIAKGGQPTDSKRYLDALEETSGKTLDGLFAEWVFPSYYDSILESRREARSRAGDLTRLTAEEGLSDEVPAAIREDVDAWRFDEAIAGLDQAEKGMARLEDLKSDLSRLHTNAAAAGLTMPGDVDDALARWDFDGAGRIMQSARRALDSYNAARSKVDGRHSLWQRFGLLGSNPSSTLESAAAAFADGDFDTAVDRAGDAADTVDSAGTVALRRLLIVAAIFGAFALVILAAVWIARLREREFA